MNDNEFNNEMDTKSIEKDAEEFEKIGNDIENEVSKSDGSEFFHHSDNAKNFSTDNSASTNDHYVVNNQQSMPRNMSENKNDANSGAVKEALNKKDKNKQNKLGDSDSNDKDKDKKKDNSSKKDDKKEKSDNKDKKSGKTKESSALRKAQDKTSNMGNNGDDASEKTETDEEMDKLGRGAAKAGDKALTLGKKGLKAIFDKLPPYVKLIVILVILIFFVILLVVMALSVTTMAYEGAMTQMCNSKITYNSQELSADDYIKGTLYNKMNSDTSIAYSDDYIKSYAIYIRSLIYKSIINDEPYQADSYTYLTYSDYTSLEDDSIKDIVTNMTTIVDETTKQYFDNPNELTEENINLIYTLSQEGKTNEEILKELSTNPDYFELNNDLEDFCTKNGHCKLIDGQTISIPHEAPPSCPLYIEGTCQCAAGVYEYMEHVLLNDKPELWSKFLSMRAKYGYNAAEYYDAAVAGDFFPSSKEPAPGDIWAYANGHYDTNGRYIGSQHVFVVLDVIDENTIEVYECNFGGNELCKIWQRNLNDQYVQNGLFMHILGECI